MKPAEPVIDMTGWKLKRLRRFRKLWARQFGKSSRADVTVTAEIAEIDKAIAQHPANKKRAKVK